MRAHSRVTPTGHGAPRAWALLSAMGSDGVVPKCLCWGHTPSGYSQHDGFIAATCQSAKRTQTGCPEPWASGHRVEACGVVAWTHRSWAWDAQAVPHASREVWCALRAREHGGPQRSAVGEDGGVMGHEEGRGRTVWGQDAPGWAVSVSELCEHTS